MNDEASSSLTPLGKLLSFLLILGLIGAGIFVVLGKTRTQQTPAGATPGGNSPTSSGGTAPPPPPAQGGGDTKGGAEAPDAAGVLTVKEYKFVSQERLPAVKGVSAYKWNDKDKTFIFTYNVWAGWLPIVAANGGTKPNPDSVFAKKYGFKVEMKLMDDPVDARDAFASGEVHSLWGTVDMLTLFAPELLKDSRTAPRIVQQIDWSNGGDGIVVRESIQNVGQLRGKTIAYAQNSPSQYYLTSLLLSAGLKPADVNSKYTKTAFEAATAFVTDKNIHGCVSWAPDIYKIPERIKGTKILSSTAEANKLIADVYAIRADFVRDHPDVVEGLVAGIFEGMDMVKDKPEVACKHLADAFGMQADEVMGMRNDAHLTNFPENVQFFLNSSNPTNFERTWKNANYVYKTLGTLSTPAAFDQVADFSFIQKLQQKGTFAHQKDENVTSFTPAAVRTIQAEKPILTQTIRINFYPNSTNPYEPARDQHGVVVQGKLYDPGVDATLERVARLSGQFDRAVVLVQGHTDSSMKGKVPVQAVQDLSHSRAQAIKQALIEKYKFDPNKFVVEGKGWELPAEDSDPQNQALNRRVEICVYPPEQK